MRECDIHQTRSIKADSVDNLSGKPGLDLCCDLLQHEQGVLLYVHARKLSSLVRANGVRVNYIIIR